MSTYTIVINDNNERNNELNKFYKDYKDYINKLDEKKLENDRKILYENCLQFIKFIDKIEEKSSEIKNYFNVENDLKFSKQKEKGKGKFKNMNCEYKIKSIYLNIIENKLQIEDKDILDNDENINKSIDLFQNTKKKFVKIKSFCE